jgi:serine O-acetyltransferase
VIELLQAWVLWQAEREPLLSSFLYASILAHSCFERSLGFVLANRLTSATLLPTQLMDIFDEIFMNDSSIRQAIRLDVQVIDTALEEVCNPQNSMRTHKGYMHRNL